MPKSHSVANCQSTGNKRENNCTLVDCLISATTVYSELFIRCLLLCITSFTVVKNTSGWSSASNWYSPLWIPAVRLSGRGIAFAIFTNSLPVPVLHFRFQICIPCSFLRVCKLFYTEGFSPRFSNIPFWFVFLSRSLFLCFRATALRFGFYLLVRIFHFRFRFCMPNSRSRFST